MAWPGLIHPPRLQHSDTETGQQRNASRLELFFDLAFVLVVAELAVELRDNLTLHGVLVFAGLFASVWWAWAGFTVIPPGPTSPNHAAPNRISGVPPSAQRHPPGQGAARPGPPQGDQRRWLGVIGLPAAVSGRGLDDPGRPTARAAGVVVDGHRVA